MLTREEILSSYKQTKFPDKLFDDSISKNKDLLFYEKSTQPSSEKIMNTQKLSESYVLPRRILIQKNMSNNQNKKNEFNRGSNFTPKEPIIDIQIENFKLLYEKFALPLETNIIYIKNTYGGVNGPFNFENIKNMYKNKKIDSNNEFRTIDIFCFKACELFSFQSLKTVNDQNWVDLVIDNKLINYTDLFKNQKKEEEKKEIVEKNKEKELKVQESEGKWEAPKKKKKKPKSKEIKEEKEEKEEKAEKEEKEKIDKNEKKEEKKIEKNEIDSSDMLEIKINKEKKEELIDILKRKQMEKEKLKDENKKTQDKKEEEKEENEKVEEEKNDKKEKEFKGVHNKKGKKKRKSQFQETEIDLGFQIK